MKKVALFALVAVVAFGFVGCASSLERNWGLKEEGSGYISDMKVEKNEVGESSYYVKIRYCGQEATVRVTPRTYDKVWIGEGVYLRLLVAAYRNEKSESGDRSCEATYTWWATDGSLDQALFVEFKMP